ncbi:O-antigen ligase family protein [Latilactobacillus curvatus]|uniref:O-antigen ligase family protein n=1 Tax=Latilactobacillus curvatus TaxID=28038 RepID=UPI00280B2B78|nr:O-antigen ligase family protein [Latilactobacillus curvatus]
MKKSIYLNKFKLWLLFLLVPFFEPQVFSFIPTLNMFFTVWQIVIFVCVFLFYLLRQKYSSYILAILLWRSYIFINTFAKIHTINSTSMKRTILIIGVSMLIEIGLNNNVLDTLETIFFILIVISILNLFTCRPGGLMMYEGTEYFLLGLRTRFTDSAIPLVLLAFLISWIKHKKVITRLTIFTIVIVLSQLVLEWVATGIFVIILLTVLIILFESKVISFPVWGSLFGVIILNISIVFFQIQAYFSFIIEGLLKKSLTFNGRTLIWNSAIQTISQHPILGFGEVDSGGFVSVYWSDRLAPAHNMILQVIHDGGIVSSFLLLFCFMLVAKKLAKYRGNMIVNIFAIGILVTGLAILTEVSSYYVHFYILPILGANIATIIHYDRQYNVDKKKI